MVVVLDTNKKQCQELCTILDERKYRTTAVHSLSELDRLLSAHVCRAVIIDIDTVTIDNRAVRKLKKENPGVFFLCLSRFNFHPDLREALGCHIYACISKPVDPDELFFWLKSIFQNGNRQDSHSEYLCP